MDQSRQPTVQEAIQFFDSIDRKTNLGRMGRVLKEALKERMEEIPTTTKELVWDAYGSFTRIPTWNTEAIDPVVDALTAKFEDYIQERIKAHKAHNAIEEARCREAIKDAIITIESLYPADAPYKDTAKIGKELLDRARAFRDWRDEPEEVLVRYAQLCIERDLRQA